MILVDRTILSAANSCGVHILDACRQGSTMHEEAAHVLIATTANSCSIFIIPIIIIFISIYSVKRSCIPIFHFNFSCIVAINGVDVKLAIVLGLQLDMIKVKGAIIKQHDVHLAINNNNLTVSIVFHIVPCDLAFFT